MNENSKNITLRLINAVKNQQSDNSPDTMIEAARSYTDPSLWLKEQQQFFIDTPQLVGFAGEIESPGSFITATVMNTPVVITRAEDGILRAFINACAHRGARVAEGCGTRKRLNCMFHGWSYGLDGKLAGRPKNECFASDNAQTNLIALPVSDNHGLLVVGCHPGVSQAQVDTFLDPLAPALQDFNFRAMRSIETRKLDVNAHWKLVVNLSHESYHFSVLHRDSLSPFMTDHFVMDSYGIHTRWAFPMKGIEQLADKPENEWPRHLPGIINHTLFPGTLLIANPQDAQIIRAEPGKTIDSSVVYYTGAYYNEDGFDEEKRIEAKKAYDFGGDIFASEDLAAAEQCQQALNAGLSQMIFGKNEPVLQYWHNLWKQQLR
ncbi:MAG: aromatic ring-hydroxylating dioxygenase subunit alpha [Pseudomonadales bacterium]|nr:aromatic ring-hydroxylating dioxygenase subunit alpha [Pseudomonadales bacterium]